MCGHRTISHLMRLQNVTSDTNTTFSAGRMLIGINASAQRGYGILSTGLCEMNLCAYVLMQVVAV